MAEFAACLIGIISAGTKVAMVLSKVASEVGSAGKEAQVMAREIRSFCTILRNISQTVDIVKEANQAAHCSEIIFDMTAASQQLFTEILDLVDSTQKVTVGPGGAKLNLAGRIKWAMNKPKFMFLRTAIEAYKSDLCLLLGSLQVAQSVDVQKSLMPQTTMAADEPVTQPERASRVISQNLEELALDYQASLQELEAARYALSEDEEEDPFPPMRRLEGSSADNRSPTATTNPRRDPKLVSMIRSLREEVGSLCSATSSVYSTNTTSSIYSSISMHSARLSQLVEQLSLDDSPALQDLRRTSLAMSIHEVQPHRDSPNFSNPISYGLAPPSGRPIPRLPRNSASASTSPVLAVPNASPLLPNRALKELRQWPGGVPPWDNTSVTLDFLRAFIVPCTAIMDEKKASLFWDWVKVAAEDLSRLHSRSKLVYMAQVMKAYALQVPQYTPEQPPVPPGPLSPGFPGAASEEEEEEEEREGEVSKSPSVEIFKSLRVSMNDTTTKILPAALRKYKINADDSYSLYLLYQDSGEERLMLPEDKPLLLFKQMDKLGKKPMFMLRKNTSITTGPISTNLFHPAYPNPFPAYPKSGPAFI
ncbi:hypothetical protein B0H63DRAFT_480742 [Podospora didyma]|uniref:Ras-associating domain-containing protein n=1 Tax=Podospora didyma TaxID=330526 RepID=A0AAE0KDS4_9PEZI|nr:hypothetical protein B0H63DRAFT_480742 [Podospora didyma]